jgi:glycerol-3-phosphate dehydrogenase
MSIPQYKLVKEALHERANLLAIAPHLSGPLPIMLPVYKYVMLNKYTSLLMQLRIKIPHCSHNNLPLVEPVNN